VPLLMQLRVPHDEEVWDRASVLIAADMSLSASPEPPAYDLSQLCHYEHVLIVMDTSR
jgi:hypothetical protein